MRKAGLYFRSRPLMFVFISFPLLAILFCLGWIMLQRMNGAADGSYSKIPHEAISVFEDPSKSLSIEQIISIDDRFTPVTAGVPNFGFNQSNIWLRFSVPGSESDFNEKILEIKNPLLNVVELYEKQGSEIHLVNITGDSYMFSSRGNSQRNYRFVLKPKEGIASEYFLMVNSGGEQLLVPLILSDAEALALHDGEDHLVRGSYFGIILFVLLFNLFVYFIVREKSTLFYVYYNFFLLLLQLSLSGYGFQYLWPGSPYFANASTPLFASLSVFALIRFSQYFLELEQYYPKYNRVFNYAGIALLVNSVLSLSGIPDLTFISVLCVNITALLLNVAIIPVAVGVYKKNFKPARYFLLAFVLLVMTVFGFILTNLGFIQNDFYADYGLQIGSTAEVVLLSLAIVDRFKQFKDQALLTLREINTLQKEQNKILEQKVIERTEEIQKQKGEIELKNEEILSSIRYAERIQKNVLTSSTDLSKLFNEHFVIYRPKDIVSGDFYWAGKTKLNGVAGPPHEVLLFAIGDCTGHGVPGAIVSVLGCNLIRETVSQFPEEPPHVLLEKMDERLQLAVNGTSHEYAGDGMDIGLWALQKDTLELRFAGANTNLSVRRGDEWLDLSGTRRPLGMRDQYSNKPFEMSALKLLPGDVIYTWTDGMTDQFGGPDGKKLKTKGVKQQIEKVAHLPLTEQKELLSQFIDQWRGLTEQTDDICFAAVKV